MPIRTVDGLWIVSLGVVVLNRVIRKKHNVQHALNSKDGHQKCITRRNNLIIVVSCHC